MGDFRRLKANWLATSTEESAPNGFNPESVSAVLRNTRILQGYNDLDEVAREIKVRASYLEAIEDGRYHDLPAIVYAQGFVAAYAKFLTLDVDDMVARFKVEATAGHMPVPQVTAPVRRASAAVDSEGESRLPNLQILAVAGVLLLAAYGAWQLAGSDNRTEALAVPPLPSALGEAAAPALPDVPQAPAVPVPTVAEGRIVLRASADSWVQIYSADGSRLASLVLHAQETYLVPQLGTLKLVTGTPENLTILAGSHSFALPKGPGERTEIWLDPARLLAATTSR